jgi:serine phosphatase RsbU (regulator of sigma subunit)
MDHLPPNIAARLWQLTYDERAVAYLQVDSALNLVAAGGNLDRYGLADLRPGEPAVEQAVFLEGLLPLFETPFLFPSLELADGRAADLHFHQDGDTVWVILLDVTDARDAARRMQQKAYDMTLLQEKEALLNRRLEAVNAALLAAQEELIAARDAARDALRRKQIELEEARTLQLALMPEPYWGMIGGRPATVSLVLEPAKEVGGDVVDHFRIGDELLVLLLGDVSDKGAAAALMMARTHALFRSLAARPDASALFQIPEQALRLVNETLAQGNSNCMFVTLLIAVLDGTTNRLTYGRAGHVPPFLRRIDGTVERLDGAGGLPLGLMEDAPYESATIDLLPGDELLIVTDGITEAMDPSQGMFGDERVVSLMAHADGREEPLLGRLLAEVKAFEAGSPQSDDVAAILLKIGSDEPYRPATSS